MKFVLVTALLSLGLCLAMLFLLEVGRRLGVHRLAQDPEGALSGTGVIDGALLGLLGLLLALTVTQGSARFNERRDLIVEETNDIGTAYLRLDLLPEAVQPALREDFRRYLNARLDVYRKLPDIAAAKKELARANHLQKEIWRQAIAGVRDKSAAPQAALILLPALNAMIDITTTRTMAMQMHPPEIIYVMLFGMALVSALLAGYGMADGKSRSPLHMLCFALIISLTVYLILDLEYPRFGFIRVDDFDQALADLRNTLN